MVELLQLEWIQLASRFALNALFELSFRQLTGPIARPTSSRRSKPASPWDTE